MSILEAAKLMRQHHIGDLVVVDETNSKQMPIGIITNRDIVVKTIAKSLGINDFSVGDVMSSQLISASDDETVFDTIRLMCAEGVRRMPVIN